MISWKGIWERSTLVKGWTVFTSGSPKIDSEFTDSSLFVFVSVMQQFESILLNHYGIKKSHQSWWFPPKRRWFLQWHFHWIATRMCLSVFSSGGPSLCLCSQNPWCGYRADKKSYIKQETSPVSQELKAWAKCVKPKLDYVEKNIPIPPQVFKVCFHHHQNAIKPHIESVRCIFL